TSTSSGGRTRSRKGEPFSAPSVYLPCARDGPWTEVKHVGSRREVGRRGNGAAAGRGRPPGGPELAGELAVVADLDGHSRGAVAGRVALLHREEHADRRQRGRRRRGLEASSGDAGDRAAARRVRAPGYSQRRSNQEPDRRTGDLLPRGQRVGPQRVER